MSDHLLFLDLLLTMLLLLIEMMDKSTKKTKVAINWNNPLIAVWMNWQCKVTVEAETCLTRVRSLYSIEHALLKKEFLVLSTCDGFNPIILGLIIVSVSLWYISHVIVINNVLMLIQDISVTCSKYCTWEKNTGYFEFGGILGWRTVQLKMETKWDFWQQTDRLLFVKCFYMILLLLLICLTYTVSTQDAPCK